MVETISIKKPPRLNKTATFSFLFEYGGRKKEGSYLHAKAIFIHRVDITKGSSANDKMENGFEVVSRLDNLGSTSKKSLRSANSRISAL